MTFESKIKHQQNYKYTTKNGFGLKINIVSHRGRCKGGPPQSNFFVYIVNWFICIWIGKDLVVAFSN